MTELARYRTRGRSRRVREAVGLGAVAVVGAAVGAMLGAASERRILTAPPRLRRPMRRPTRSGAVVDADGSALFV